jgi:paraquat-inducible protein A
MNPGARRAVRCSLCNGHQSIPALPPGHKARCYRCESVLDPGKTLSLDAPLALSFGALILWAAANGLPFLTLEYQGIVQTNFLVTGAAALWKDDQYFLGLLVGLTSILIPAAQLGLTCRVLLALGSDHPPKNLASLLRVLECLTPWAMSGVYVIGVLVAGVKLGQLATLTPGPGLYCFVGLVLLSTLAAASLDFKSLGLALQAREQHP